MSNCEQGRYEFLVIRDGELEANKWMRELVKTYRNVVLSRKSHTMYRKQLVCGYVCAKKLLRNVR